jgi:hypothetical protein
MKKRGFKKGLNRLMGSRFTQKEREEINSEVKKELLKIKLADLRRVMNITQSEMEGCSQPAIASLEKRKDMKISTLASYLSKIGMGMEIKVFPKHRKPTVPKEMLLLKM